MGELIYGIQLPSRISSLLGYLDMNMEIISAIQKPHIYACNTTICSLARHLRRLP